MMQHTVDKQRRNYTFLTIMLISMAVRFFFVLYTSVYAMQHDAGTPYENYGHLGYIAYFMNNWQLPNFDVREAFQFWHPPLHHFISAVFLTVTWKLFPALTGNYEPLQLLPFLYITLCIYILYKIFLLWNPGEKALLCITLLTAFQPTFITLSGSINNDALCTLLTFLSLYFAFLWYQKPSYKLIIFCALSLGLGMSTKGSAAIAAFPIGFLFFMKLIEKKKKIIGQLLVFTALVFPLGLWWYLRNYIKFDVPINYIYYMSTDTVGYLKDIPLWQKILDFDPRRFLPANQYLQFEGRFTDANPIIGLLKTAVYGQWRFNYSPYIRLLSYPLLLIWTFLSVLSLAGIPVFLKRNGKLRIQGISILILAVVQFISYYHFCLSYPFVWTMDFRYAIPLLLCQLLFLADFIQGKEKINKYITYACMLFVAISVLCFILLAFT